MENRFDLYDLPEGHTARFEARLETGLARRRRRSLAFRWTAAAAVLGAVTWVGMHSDPHFRRARTPEAIYTAYLKQVGELYQLLASHTESDIVDWESILQELTDEPTPLYEQLPEEMHEKKKMALLKSHYGGLLDDARQLQEELKNQ